MSSNQELNDKEARPTRPTAGLGLSRERILGKAMELADARGLECLSMRSLAAALGYKAMSLYNHVSSRDELVAELVDRVIAEIALPEAGADWKCAMRKRAMEAHRVLRTHPWATLAIVSGVNAGPAMLSYVEATLASLVEAGFSLEDADRAWNALDSFIYGFTLQELRFPIKKEDYRTAAEAFLPSLPEDRYPCFSALGRLVVEGGYDGQNRLEYGLDLLLEGLERERSRSEGKSRGVAGTGTR